MGGRLEEMAKLDDTVNIDMEPEEALKLLLEDDERREEDEKTEAGDESDTASA
jgi:hypothetical protein